MTSSAHPAQPESSGPELPVSESSQLGSRQNSHDAPIEAIFHFIWFGPELPDFAVIAIVSALRNNPGSRAILWHEEQLQSVPALQALTKEGLELREIQFERLVEQVNELEAAFDAKRLIAIYEQLRAPAARSNLLRLLVLYLYGGVYLDTDTLTIKDLTPLLKEGAFCGREHLLWPTGRPIWHAGALGLDALRWLCGRLPFGFRVHQRLLRFYDEAANNAVLAFRRGHPFCGELLAAATEVPPADWFKRFRFGTHLLQQGIQRQEPLGSAKEMSVGQSKTLLQPARMASQKMHSFPPEYFYPQGPVISLHYFRETSSPQRAAMDLLSEQTFVIHWYASVAELGARDASHIALNKDRELYSHLCAAYLPLFNQSTPD